MGIHTRATRPPRSTAVRLAILVAVLELLAPAPVSAQSTATTKRLAADSPGNLPAESTGNSSAPSIGEPWARGVSLDHQRRAKEMCEALHKQLLGDQAARKYEEVLRYQESSFRWNLASLLLAPVLVSMQSPATTETTAVDSRAESPENSPAPSIGEPWAHGVSLEHRHWAKGLADSSAESPGNSPVPLIGEPWARGVSLEHQCRAKEPAVDSPAELPGNSPAPSIDEPWAYGVSLEHRRRAKELAKEAVALHKQLLRDQAAGKYEEALQHWEHPSFRWNLALLWRDVGQPLRAYENLKYVFAWGEDAFEEQDQTRYRNLRDKLLENYLAIIEVACDEPGASVALDGTAWFMCEGSERRVVLPGEHVIIATKPGYFSVVESFNLPAGKHGRVTLRMDVDGLFEKRRFAIWKPWAALGAGTAVMLLGGGLLWQAKRDYATAARVFLEMCSTQTRCTPDKPDPYKRAVWGNRLAVGAFIIGGVGLAAGLTLVALNRPRAFRTEARDRSQFQLIPMISSDSLGASADFRF